MFPPDDVFVDAPPAPTGVAIAEIEHLREPLVEALSKFAGRSVADLTPEERSELADLREFIDGTAKTLLTWRDAIDQSFRRAATEAGAKEIVLADGVIVVTAPQNIYTVDDFAGFSKALDALEESGVLSAEDRESFMKVTVYEKVDNAVLNRLISKRGAALKEVVDAYRRVSPGPAREARLTFKRKEA